MDCRYCAKYGEDGLAHVLPNNILKSKCSYNKKWTGWRPEWVCKKIGYISRSTTGAPNDGVGIRKRPQEIMTHG